jgi:hypothetical protein
MIKTWSMHRHTLLHDKQNWQNKPGGDMVAKWKPNGALEQTEMTHQHALRDGTHQ